VTFLERAALILALVSMVCAAAGCVVSAVDYSDSGDAAGLVFVFLFLMAAGMFAAVAFACACSGHVI
jgi:hypothetical protein